METPPPSHSKTPRLPPSFHLPHSSSHLHLPHLTSSFRLSSLSSSFLSPISSLFQPIFSFFSFLFPPLPSSSLFCLLSLTPPLHHTCHILYRNNTHVIWSLRSLFTKQCFSISLSKYQYISTLIITNNYITSLAIFRVDKMLSNKTIKIQYINL